MDRWNPINNIFAIPSEECFYAPRCLKDLFPKGTTSIPFPSIKVATEGTIGSMNVCVDKCYNLLCTPEAGMIMAFITGLIFAPWAWGLFYLVLFIIIYEIVYYIMVWGDPNKWDPIYRGAKILFYIAGWVFGRWLLTDVLFPNDLPVHSNGPWDLIDHAHVRRLH